MKQFLMVLLLLGFGAANAVAAGSRIACWGDSLTAGDSGKNAYPTVLADLIKRPVYNGGVGGQNSTAVAARMLADQDKRGDIAILWVGRNNFREPAQVLADVASMVATLEEPKRFLVLSVLNGETPDEESGGVRYQMIEVLNRALAAAYPKNYLDVRSYLVSQFDPRNAADLLDHARDVPPYSLRSVDVHGTLTTALNATDVGMTTDAKAYPGVIVTVDAEMIFYAAPTAHGYAAPSTRGYAGTAPAAHAAGTPVSGVDPLHLSGKGYAVVARKVAERLRDMGYVD